MGIIEEALVADAEVVQDTLTCGGCQKSYPLSEICKFIGHKSQTCNKENYSCGFTGTDQDVNEDSDDGAQAVSVNSRRPSISAPISGKKQGPQAAALAPSSLLDASSRLEERLGVTAPPPSPQHPGASSSHDALLSASGVDSRPASRAQHLSERDFKPQHIKQESDVERSRAFRSPDVADAGSNTIVSEPSNYVCSTCKQRFHSAWTLMKHVQEGHGIKIYIDLEATSTPPAITSAPSIAPLAPPVVSRLHELPPRSSIPSIQPPLPSALDPHNPFNILRMSGDRNFSNSSLAAAAAAALNPFARPPPSSHDFRMEQLVSEQFRLNSHGLNLAAALEQARPPHFATDPFERPPSTRSTSSSGAPSSAPVPPPPPPTATATALGALNLEPQLDFYSQRLRQLAGTTSPGGGSSPSSRKPILTPPFTSPNNNSAPRSSQQETTPPTAGSSASHKAGQPSTSGSSSSLLSQSLNNSSSSGNGSVGRASLSPPQMRPPSQPLSSLRPTSEPHESDLTPLPSTPRAQSTPPDPSKVAAEAAAEVATELTSFPLNNIKSCEYCGKQFKSTSSLEVHRSLHTGDKPYRCQICSHTCSQASKLKRHMKIHRMTKKNGGAHNGSTISTPESGETDSLGGSIETLDSDEDKTDDEDELEEMELEEEEDEDEGEGSGEDVVGDAPEDLTTKSSSSATSTPTQNTNKGEHDRIKLSHPSMPIVGSLVSELMSKYGLTDIQQYNEAYKQALKESSSRMLSNDDKPLHGNNNERIKDNNNIPHSLMKKRHENGLDKIHEDMRKVRILQPPMDINPNMFNPFDLTFDASKRLKLDLENHPRNERDIYAGLSWLPTMAPTPRDLFGVDHPNFDLLGGRKSSHDKSSRDMSKAGPSAMTAAAVAAGLNLGLGSGVGGVPGRKESRRNDTCEYCGKVFKNCSNLTVHRRSHTGEKPYKCELCSYACAQSSKLTRHMKTHGRLGKDVYRCRFCEMPFSVPSTLEKHMRKCVVNQNNKAAAAANASGLMASMIAAGDDTGDSSASASKDTT
ncbi:Hypothetical predicted protein [Cloeon dipterum]|uniref:Protein hunchback n=1 Tax=Cloeon dipterum TaxID=197152 RepID=A0A8S1C4F4_9INSE|nr:Hypothetical predicted protein [Cloeon dipterum]